MAEEMCCKNCDYWNMHSLDMKLGDCMAPNDHRYWRVPINGGGYALLDGFGREETKPNFSCGAFKAAEPERT